MFIFFAGGESVSAVPFVGRKGNWECGSVALTPANIVGFMSRSAPGEPGTETKTERVSILYRVGAVSRKIELRMSPRDAEALGVELGALLRGVRSKPIRIQARKPKEGDCEVLRVIG